MIKKILLIMALILTMATSACAVGGTYTDNVYFYLPAYGAYGVAEWTEYNTYMQIADTQIKANKNPFSNVVQCSDYDHPDDAITAISTDNKTLLVTESETCDLNFTVPANVTVKFERGGKWTINNGITVTSNGSLQAGLWQIFAYTGTGVVHLENVKEVYPEWWGADNTGTDDTASAFTSMILSFTTKGNVLIGKQSIFKVDTAIAIGSKEIFIYGGGTIKLGADVYAFSVSGGILELNGINFTTLTSETGFVADALSASKGIFKNNIITNLSGGFGGYWDDSIFEGNDISILPASSGGNYAIHFAGSHNKIIDNKITGGRHQVYMSGGTEDYGTVEGNIIDGNVLTGAGWGAIATNCRVSWGAEQYNIISNNTIIDSLGIPIELYGNVDFNKIIGNLISGFSGGHGIAVRADTSTTPWAFPEGNIIENNTIICKVANDTTHYNIQILDGNRNIIKNNTLIRPITDTSAVTRGINLDSQTTPNTSWNQIIGNIFIFCKLNNASIDNTLIEGNSFYTYAGMTPIFIDGSGTANVGINNLGGTEAFITIADGDTTPDISGGYKFTTSANTGATAITDLDNPTIGQIVTLIGGSDTDASTITDGGNFNLDGDITLGLSKSITLLVQADNDYIEVCRNVITTKKLSAFAATTSAELAGVISDETGSGASVFADTPTLVTPALGVATAVQITTTNGEELITNGTFDSNIDDWIVYLDGGDGTIAWDSGTIKLTEGTSSLYLQASQAITTVANRIYAVTVTVTATDGNNRIYIGTTLRGSELFNGSNILCPSTETYVFKATGTTAYITLQQYGAVGEYGNWDNISIKLNGNINTSGYMIGGHINKVVTIADGDTTPDVKNANIFITSSNTGATEITDFDNPVVGQIITIIIGNATNPSTITDSGNFALSANWTPDLDDVITLFVKADNDYIELSRSAN